MAEYKFWLGEYLKRYINLIGLVASVVEVKFKSTVS
jgi:hypothetical protein